MQKRWCPRCHSTWEVVLFQEPLSMCLVCYARVPGNKGLPFDELIEKAKKSSFAHRRKNKEEARSLAVAMQRYQLSKKEISQETQDALATMPCDYCNEEVEFDDENIIGVTDHGENKLCCRGCLPAALTAGAIVLQQAPAPVVVDESIGNKILNIAAKRRSND